MAKIRVDDIKSIRALRELVKSDDLFPYADYSPDDTDVVVSITLYKKDPDNPNLRYASREYNEVHDPLITKGLREAIFQELWKVNPDTELVEKLKELGITLEIPQNRGKWF